MLTSTDGLLFFSPLSNRKELRDLTSPATNWLESIISFESAPEMTSTEEKIFFIIIHPKQIGRSKDRVSLMKGGSDYYAVYCIQNWVEWGTMEWDGTWITGWIWTRFEPTVSQAYGNHAIMNCCLLCSLQGILPNILHWVCSYPYRGAHMHAHTLWAVNDCFNNSYWIKYRHTCTQNIFWLILLYRCF